MKTILSYLEKMPLKWPAYLGIFSNGAAIVFAIWVLADGTSVPLLMVICIAINAHCLHTIYDVLREDRKATQEIPVYEISHFLAITLFNGQWITQHQKAVCDLLPTTWTHVGNLDVRRMVETLRELGMAIDVPEDFYEVIKILVHMRLLLRNGDLLKRNPINVVFVMEQGGTQ